MWELHKPSKSPAELQEGDVYLCGKVSLVDDIDWVLCIFENGGLRDIDHKTWNAEEFMCCKDGNYCWLIFELPDNIGQI
jgi:hypothetical protein